VNLLNIASRILAVYNIYMSTEHTILYSDEKSNQIVTSEPLETISPSEKIEDKKPIFCKYYCLCNKEDNGCCYYKYEYSCYKCKSEGCNCSTCKNYKNPQKNETNNSFVLFLFPCCK